MHEPYRTLLGHFRHESGHYYWDRLIEGSARLESFRSKFGDERRGARLSRPIIDRVRRRTGLSTLSAPIAVHIRGRIRAENVGSLPPYGRYD